MSLPQNIIVGTVVADPELRQVSSGSDVVSFRVATNDRRKTADGTWEDGATTYVPCNAWRQQAVNIASTFTRGMRVIVLGRLKQRDYTTKDGDKRTVYEVEVDECGPTLAFATAVVDKSGKGSAPRSAPTQSAGNDPWQGQQADDAAVPF